MENPVEKNSKKTKKKLRVRYQHEGRVDAIEAKSLLLRLVSLNIPDSKKRKSKRWHSARAAAVREMQTVQKKISKAFRRCEEVDRNEERKIIKKTAGKVSKLLFDMDKHSKHVSLWLELERSWIMKELDHSRVRLKFFSQQETDEDETDSDEELNRIANEIGSEQNDVPSPSPSVLKNPVTEIRKKLMTHYSDRNFPQGMLMPPLPQLTKEQEEAIAAATSKAFTVAQA